MPDDLFSDCTLKDLVVRLLTSIQEGNPDTALVETGEIMERLDAGQTCDLDAAISALEDEGA